MNLRKNFENWLVDCTELADKTINNYIRGINDIPRRLEGTQFESIDIYIIDNASTALELLNKLKNEEKFIDFNSKGNNMYSAALGRYIEFLEQRVSGKENFWFVGAYVGENPEDKTVDFVENGYWYHDFENKHMDKVNAMKVGERIAIKSTYTRKQNIPFDNKDNLVSVMSIKAIGTIKNNINNGHRVEVEWDKNFRAKEWYFYTYRGTIWRLDREHSWRAEALIKFAFENTEQNIDKFLNEPYWRDRYSPNNKYKFDWIPYYEELAAKLLKYKNNRQDLINDIKVIYESLNLNFTLEEKDDLGNTISLTDVCPFTIFGLFNRGIKTENRVDILTKLGDLIGLESPIPTSFDSIPILNNMNSWFFGYTKERYENDIDNLWNMFEIAIKTNDKDYEHGNKDFSLIFDLTIKQRNVKWKLTMGLYWIRPNDYLPLDGNTKQALITLGLVDPNYFKNTISGEQYIEIISLLNDKFAEEDFPAHSIPEFSYKAWSKEFEKKDSEISIMVTQESEDEFEEYTKNDFLNEVFLNDDEYETIKSLLETKKNLILQGSPGVGKTFAARKLAYSLMGTKNPKRICFIQFHQSYAYEDFIEGYRPKENGFELKKGPFYRFCIEATKYPEQDFFFIIDEINRGNLSKIFGELMMLIESDKRDIELSLTYSDEGFAVPENVYIIGMMNTADRSLAIIDYALRRRFCFYELEPAFDKEQFKEYLINQGADEEIIDKIRHKFGDLNIKISDDPNLGKGFRIGHSYFCNYRNNMNWYEQIIKYEIKMLVNEYWFDEVEKAEEIIKGLLN